MLSSILFCFELHFCACFFSPPGQPLHEERRDALAPSLTGSQTASCVVGTPDWNIASQRLQLPSPLSLHWYGSSLNVWFHSPSQDYRHKVKAYMCMYSCHEWIMYSDSRSRWIYDHLLKRIAVTLNQEVLVKTCYNYWWWTHCGFLSMSPRSSPTVRAQKILEFQLCTKLHAIASCHFPKNQLNSNAFKHKQLDVPYPSATTPSSPLPSPSPWQMALINTDMITRFPAINTQQLWI